MHQQAHQTANSVQLLRGTYTEIARRLHVDPSLVSRIARALMSSMNQTVNAPITLPSLPRGTYIKIARRLHVHPSLVSRVARGLMTSARVTAALEAERKNHQTANNRHRNYAQTVTQA